MTFSQNPKIAEERTKTSQRYLAEKIGHHGYSASKAREALLEAIKIAKDNRNSAVENLAIGLFRVCESQEIISRDIEFIRARLDVIEQTVRRPSHHRN
jgi:hypothetical protein